MFHVEHLNKKTMDYIKLVEDLNDLLYSKITEPEIDFSYLTNGYVDSILFGDITIWDSENDGREWLESTNAYEDFLPFIKNQYNKHIEKLNQFKF